MFLFWQAFNPVQALINHSSPSSFWNLEIWKCINANWECMLDVDYFFNTQPHLLLLSEWRSKAHVVVTFCGWHSIIPSGNLLCWGGLKVRTNVSCEPSLSRHDKALISLVSVSRLFVLMYTDRWVMPWWLYGYTVKPEFQVVFGLKQVCNAALKCATCIHDPSEKNKEPLKQ